MSPSASLVTGRSIELDSPVTIPKMATRHRAAPPPPDTTAPPPLADTPPRRRRDVRHQQARPPSASKTPFPPPCPGQEGAVCRPAQRATSPCTPRHVAVLHASPQTAATSADCTQPGRLVHARCPRRWRWRKAALPLRSRRGRLVVPPAAAVGRSRSAPALGGMSSSSGGVAPLRTFRLP